MYENALLNTEIKNLFVHPIVLSPWWLQHKKCYKAYDGRQWKYNPSIPEFFVEDETTTCLKISDTTKETTTTEMEVPSLTSFE